MELSAENIKALREQTAAGLMDCKRALTQANGDVAAAVDILRKKGFAMAEKKAERVARQGVVEAYIHGGGKLGVLLELNCESDFVARTPEFKALAHDLAMQIAASAPKFVAPEDVPQGQTATSDNTLLLQCYIKDPARIVKDIITEVVARTRENIKVTRFSRFELGAEN